LGRDRRRSDREDPDHSSAETQAFSASPEALVGAGQSVRRIDTCHSGNAYNQRLGNAAYHANIIACTAARFDQTAREDDKLGHGLFTYAMVEGLEGKGGIAQRREITTKSLADYVIKRVEEFAKAQNVSQEPQYFKGRVGVPCVHRVFAAQRRSASISVVQPFIDRQSRLSISFAAAHRGAGWCASAACIAGR